MRKIILPIILLLCFGCNATYEKSVERIDKSCTNPPADVINIKDSFPMSNDFYSHKKEYLVSRNYIGIRYVNKQDTIIEEPVPDFPPKVIKVIHSYGKDIIPYLISQIDRGTMASPNFVNPYESNLQRIDLIGGPLGINYAYMIELILAKDSIKDNYTYKGGYSGWYEKVKPYKVYDHCTIIEKKYQYNPAVTPLSVDDMKTIKDIYNKWWESNKKENLDALRKKWREEGSPLQKSPFTWI